MSLRVSRRQIDIEQMGLYNYAIILQIIFKRDNFRGEE